MNNIRKYGAFLPLILCALGAGELLGRQFWFDESLTLLNFALLPVEKIYTSYVIPNNHIGYTFLLHWHYLLAPDGISPDLWCRLLSLAAAFAFIVFSYQSIKKSSYRILLAAFAVSVPFAIYATSVRGYMAALFFAALTLHTACKFARNGGGSAGVLYFLSSLGCVAVLPSDILVCAAVVVYALPLCGKYFDRSKRFYILGAIPVAAFILFWMPIYPQLYAASRLGEGWQSPWRVLGAVAATYFAVAFIPAVCAVMMAVFRNKWRVKDLRLTAFLVIIPLLFCTKVAPFPRVFFPFAGVFLAITAQYFQMFLALLRKHSGTHYRIVLTAIWVLSVGCTAALNWSPVCRAFLNRVNGYENDDYFIPWYVRSQHDPRSAASTAAKLDYPVCYMSFSSDPWSVMFYGALNSADMNCFIFDGPRGKTAHLPHNALVIINASEDIKQIEKRFNGSCQLLWKSPNHKIYRFSQY